MLKNRPPSPCQGHGGNFSTALGMTVENQKEFLFTAVFEYFLTPIAVVWVGFAGSYCQQAIGKLYNSQYYQRLLFFLLSAQKNHVCDRQYEKHLFTLVLSYYATLAVENQKSKLLTVDPIHNQQFIKEFSCFLLPTWQSIFKKARYELSTQFTTNSP